MDASHKATNFIFAFYITIINKIPNSRRVIRNIKIKITRKATYIAKSLYSRPINKSPKISC